MENYFDIKYVKKEKKNHVENKNELILDKFKPRLFKDFTFQKEYANKLCNVLKSKDNIMNLFLYGGNGVGKYVLAKSYINEYLDLIDENINLKICKTDTKELEYHRFKYHIELIIYKYNFNDQNLINHFFKEICLNSNDQCLKKNIVLIKNIHLIRKENLFLFKNNIEKYQTNNIFIFISLKPIPLILKGYFCPLRINKLPKIEMIKLANILLKELNITKFKKKDIDDLADNCNGNIVLLKNNIENSHIYNDYYFIGNNNEYNFNLIYIILKKKNFNQLRDLILELLIENVNVNELLKFLVKKFSSAKSINNKKKDLIISVLVKCDRENILGLRTINHLEYAFLKIINIL